jgi:hypothetical protein
MKYNLYRGPTWDKTVEVSRIIWGDFSWRHELMCRCDVTDRTIRRWQKRGYVPGPVGAMLHAFLRLRRYDMTLPPDVGLAP